MGGNAIRPLAEKLGLATTRLSRELADRTQRQIGEQLGVFLLQPKTFPTKEDFGDLDLLGDFRNSDPVAIQKRIGAVGFAKNGSVTSYALPHGTGLFQVDLIHVLPQDMDFVSRYMAWGGAGNFLGKVSRHYGLKLSENGLYAQWNDSGQIYFLPVTKSFGEALKILDYDFDRFEKGFSREEDFLEFLRSSRFFRKEAFSVEAMRHRDRVRERRNHVFRNFVESLDRHGQQTLHQSSEIMKLQVSFLEYPLFREALTKLGAELEEKRLFAKKWNGEMISSLTGLTRKDLGNFIAEFSSRFVSTSEFHAWVLRAPEEKIRLEVLAAYAFKNVPDDLDVRVVGGAVRNAVLGLKVKDIDYVVVGQTKNDMLERGFSMIGKDFPVFLGKDGREYALARRERQTGQGHKGFCADTRNVTLEEDLYRRDLTINAIALSKDGTLTDPFGGMNDLESGTLRNVSDHFGEDPLRVLRTARFYSVLGSRRTVNIAPNLRRTLTMVVQSGALELLPKERVLQEIAGCLDTETPSMSIRLLHECGALRRILPEVAALDGVPQPPEWHPEGDAFIHTLLVLDNAAAMKTGTAVRFAAMVHDLGKALTPKELLPKHHGHEEAGLPLVAGLCDRLGVPSSWKQLAMTVTEKHLKVHRIAGLKPSSTHDLLASIGGTRNDSEAFFEAVLAVCQADDYGKNRKGEYLPGITARALSKAALTVTGETLAEEFRNAGRKIPEGPEFGARLREARISSIRNEKRRLEELSR